MGLVGKKLNSISLFILIPRDFQGEIICPESVVGYTSHYPDTLQGVRHEHLIYANYSGLTTSHKVHYGLLQGILPKGSDFGFVNLSNSTPITLNSKSKTVSTFAWKKSLSIFECSLFQLFTRCSKAMPRVLKPATWAMPFCVRLGMRA